MEILREKEDVYINDELNEIVDICYRNVVRLDTLTDKILNIFKYQSKDNSVDIKQCNYVEVISDILFELKPLILDKKTVYPIRFSL